MAEDHLCQLLLNSAHHLAEVQKPAETELLRLRDNHNVYNDINNNNNNTEDKNNNSDCDLGYCEGLYLALVDIALDPDVSLRYVHKYIHDDDSDDNINKNINSDCNNDPQVLISMLRQAAIIFLKNSINTLLTKTTSILHNTKQSEHPIITECESVKERILLSIAELDEIQLPRFLESQVYVILALIARSHWPEYFPNLMPVLQNCMFNDNVNDNNYVLSWRAACACEHVLAELATLRLPDKRSAFLALAAEYSPAFFDLWLTAIDGIESTLLDGNSSHNDNLMQEWLDRLQIAEQWGKCLSVTLIHGWTSIQEDLQREICTRLLEILVQVWTVVSQPAGTHFPSSPKLLNFRTSISHVLHGAGQLLYQLIEHNRDFLGQSSAVLAFQFCSKIIFESAFNTPTAPPRNSNSSSTNNINSSNDGNTSYNNDSGNHSDDDDNEIKQQHFVPDEHDQALIADALSVIKMMITFHDQCSPALQELLAESIEQVSELMITKFLVLSEDDLYEWQANAEQFLQDEERCRDKIRPLAKGILWRVLKTNLDRVLAVIINLWQQVHDIDNPNGLYSIDTVLQKNAVYMAVGMASRELSECKDVPSIDQWFEQTLSFELTELSDDTCPSSFVLRHRIVWLLGEWAPQIINHNGADFVQGVHSALVNTLLNDSDVITRIAVVRSLVQFVEASQTPKQLIQARIIESSEQIVTGVFLLTTQVEELDSKNELLNSLKTMLKNTHFAQTAALPVVDNFEELWELCEQYNVVRLVMLRMLSTIVESLGSSAVRTLDLGLKDEHHKDDDDDDDDDGTIAVEILESDKFQEFVGSVLDHCLDLKAEEKSYLVRPGLALWRALLQVTTRLTPVLFNLLDSWPRLIRECQETVPLLEIMYSYLLLNSTAYLASSLSPECHIFEGRISGDFLTFTATLFAIHSRTFNEFAFRQLRGPPSSSSPSSGPSSSSSISSRISQRAVHSLPILLKLCDLYNLLISLFPHFQDDDHDDDNNNDHRSNNPNNLRQCIDPFISGVVDGMARFVIDFESEREKVEAEAQEQFQRHNDDDDDDDAKSMMAFGRGRGRGRGIGIGIGMGIGIGAGKESSTQFGRASGRGMSSMGASHIGLTPSQRQVLRQLTILENAYILVLARAQVQGVPRQLEAPDNKELNDFLFKRWLEETGPNSRPLPPLTHKIQVIAACLCLLNHISLHYQQNETQEENKEYLMELASRLGATLVNVHRHSHEHEHDRSSSLSSRRPTAESIRLEARNNHHDTIYEEIATHGGLHGYYNDLMNTLAYNLNTDLDHLMIQE